MLGDLWKEMERDDFSKIHTWKDYGNESHDNNKVVQQFNNLLMAYSDPVLDQKFINKCAHNHFENQQVFLQLIHDYINNKSQAVHKLNKHDNTVKSLDEMIKTGICINCMHRFIIKTNGLNDIYIRWKQNTEYLTSCLKRFRFEFMNTNIIICQQPLFIKCILLKSNMHCLRKIFRLFFISYLKETNLNELIVENTWNISDPFRIWSLPNSKYKYEFAIANNNINICHGFEHSLCTLSTAIVCLLPLLKLHHIKYLFIDDDELKNVTQIIDEFLFNYTNLPHIQKCKESELIKMQQFVMDKPNKLKYWKWRKKIQKDRDFAKFWPYKDDNNEPIWISKNDDVSIDAMFDELIDTKHPILQRIMFIISSLYQHFYFHRLRLKKKIRKTKIEGNESQLILMEQLKQQRKRFDDYIYKTMDFWTKRVGKYQGKYSDHIWSLIDCYIRCCRANKYFKIEHYKKIQCGACNKQQIDFPKNRLKICNGCKLAYYCNKKCQKYDWSRNKHREICDLLNSSVDPKC